ncbi:co-chaperone GroES [Candidatus Acetothermia bacterium]|nr:co-chaperone GroES [Candidatus Acetothermia bacterium]MBI3459922.1 co-chaperone GroES [Candidatus Acetothermia bacterium]
MKKLKIQPLGSRVLVRKLEEVTEESGGIILPEEAKKDQGFVRAQVVEIGPKKEKISVRKGDKVLLSGFSGTELEMSGEKYFIVKSKDILAVIE